jgi:uncharacterized membrane protein YfcA
LNHLFFFGSCVAVGALSGFLGGLLGIGGGIVIVPALIILFDTMELFPQSIATPVAVGTSLAVIIFTSLAAARTQIRAGMVDWDVVRRWAPFLIIGSFLAGPFLLFVSCVMLTNWKPDPHRKFPGAVAIAGIGMLGGLISGIAGVGGGNVMVPTLVYFNKPVHRATATSSTLGVPIATAGTRGFVYTGWNAELGPALLGFVYLPAFVAIVLATVVTAPMGVRVAYRVAPLPLRRGFGLLLVVIAARTLYSAF